MCRNRFFLFSVCISSVYHIPCIMYSNSTRPGGRLRLQVTRVRVQGTWYGYGTSTHDCGWDVCPRVHPLPPLESRTYAHHHSHSRLFLFSCLPPTRHPSTHPGVPVSRLSSPARNQQPRDSPPTVAPPTARPIASRRASGRTIPPRGNTRAAPQQKPYRLPILSANNQLSTACSYITQRRGSRRTRERTRLKIKPRSRGRPRPSRRAKLFVNGKAARLGTCGRARAY